MIKEIRYSKFIEEAPMHRVLIDDMGREVLDTTPVSIPLNISPPVSSMAQLMHQLYASMKAENHDVETFADADDFDVPDELGIEMESTPYEQNFDHSAGNPAPAPEPVPVPSEPEKVTE